MASDYYIDPTTGDIVYQDGDVRMTAGIENLLYLTLAIERGTYWANPDLGSEVKALMRDDADWPVIVDAARWALLALQQRGLLVLLGVSHDPETRELVIDVEELAHAFRYGVDA